MEVTRIIFLLLLFTSCSKQDKSYVTITDGVYSVGEQDNSMNPFREVSLNSFTISKYELTNKEFETFVKATNYITDAEKYKDALVLDLSLPEYEWKEDPTANWRFPQGVSRGGIETKMNHPVTTISFNDAMVYCNWANVRLPLLAEWEVASSGDDNNKHFFKGKLEDIHQYANIWKGKTHQEISNLEKHIFTAPVGSYSPNQKGLYDVYGNVFELCLDVPEYIKEYKHLAASRGGSWWCSFNSCNYFNSHDVGRVNKQASFSNVGFRVVK